MQNLLMLSLELDYSSVGLLTWNCQQFLRSSVSQYMKYAVGDILCGHGQSWMKLLGVPPAEKFWCHQVRFHYNSLKTRLMKNTSRLWTGDVKTLCFMLFSEWIMSAVEPYESCFLIPCPCYSAQPVCAGQAPCSVRHWDPFGLGLFLWCS